MLKANEIIKIIREAKNAGVEEIDITPDGKINVKFGKKPISEFIDNPSKSQLEDMQEIAEEAKEENKLVEQETDFAELDLIDPVKYEELVNQNDVVQDPETEL